ncbi:MAG: 4a-hydroxytetrahydrobiopterin dehydratase [Flavobacterium sp.]|nr:4a-hydroxytetrahydrobiopterin dehydratase [Flavobacterium sp.]
MTAMNETIIKKQLQLLNSWSHIDDAIEKNYSFTNFAEALAFINKVGAIAEKMNHHPELFNVYNKVKLRLTTHDAHGITQKDFDLAAAVDAIP